MIKAKYIFFSLCTLASLFTSAQTEVQVSDARNGEPLSFELSWGPNRLTFVQGKASIQIEHPVVLTIESEDYLPEERLVKPGQSYHFYLYAKTTELGEVVVSDVHSINKPQQTVLNVSRITSKRIEQLGAVDLRDALSFENNIRINRDNALGSSGLSLMGISGNNVKLMVDGVPVIGRLFGQLDLEQFNLINSSQVEVIRGPMSVIYGSNALAGTINLISNNPTKRRASLRATHETDGQYHLSGQWSQPINNHLISLSGGRMFFNGWSAGDSDRTFDWIPKEQYNARLAYQYRTDSFRVNIRSEYTRAFLLDRGAPLLPYGEFAIDQKYTNQRLDHSINLFWQRKYGHLNIIAGQNHFKRIKNKFYKDLVLLEEQLIPLQEEQDTQGFDAYLLRAIYGFSHGNYETLIGLDANHEIGEGKRIASLSQQQTDVALFSSTEFRLKRWILRTGLRYAYNSAFSSPLIYSFQSRYDLDNSQVIKLAYGRGFRAPSLKELYLDFNDSRHAVYGNDQLAAESSHSFTSTYQKYLSKGDWTWFSGVDLFYNRINNKIELTILGPLEATYNNISRFETVGSSISQRLSYKNLNLSVSFNYTGRYTGIEDAEADFNYSAQWLIQPNVVFPEQQLSLNLFINHFGALNNVFEDTASGELSITEMAAYSMIDFSLNKKFLNKRLNLTAGARNLLNVVNITSTLFQGAHSQSSISTNISPGRTYFITLRYELFP